MSEAPESGSSIRRRLGGLLALFATYLLAHGAALQTAVEPEKIAAAWPPSGLALAALLLAGRSRWREVVATILVANVAANAIGGYGPGVVASFALVESLGPLAGAWLVARLVPGPVSLGRTRDVVVLFLAGGVAASGAVALAGAAIPVVAFGAGYAETWRTWWISDGLGVLVVAPAVLAFASLRPGRPRAWRVAEAGLLGAALVVVAHLVFASDPARSSLLASLPYATIPFLFWAAARFGPAGAAATSFVLALVATWHTVAERGPFAFGSSAADRILAVQLFLGVATLSALVLAALLEELRRAKGLAEGARRNLATTLDSIGDAVIVTDASSRITRLNPVAERLTGWPSGEAVGRPLAEVFRIQGAGSGEPLGDPVAQVLRGGGAELADDALLVARGGRKRRIADSGAPIRDPSGAVLGVVLVFRDVTEEHLLQQRLSQAQRMEAVGRLAGGVAHDFNNLLTVILAQCEEGARGPHEGDTLREVFEEISAAARSAAGLTRQLLLFGRKQIDRPIAHDLEEVVRGARPMLERLIGEDIELVFRLGGGLGAVRADPGQMEQVLLNLCVNARDAMPSGGRLVVETTSVTLDEDYARRHPGAQARPHVLLAVSDTGVGMDEETRLRVFEPFYTTKGPGRGTGLGLATVHAIVTAAGGHVEVYSELGRGTVFRVYLPELPRSGEAPANPPRGEVPRGSETVLLVEDAAAVRSAVRGYLERAGYAVLEADTPEAALALAERGGAIGLLLTDVVMPGMSGRELAERFGEKRPGVPVLYMTGYTDDAVIRRIGLEESAALVQKPLTFAVLARAVRAAIDGT